MGKLPQSPVEVRLAVTLFLGLLGIADFFGGWQVKNFAAFTPRGVAATVAPEDASRHGDGVLHGQLDAGEAGGAGEPRSPEPSHHPRTSSSRTRTSTSPSTR